MGPVECKLCGSHFMSLNSHLKNEHQLSCWDYLGLFPGSELTAQEIKDNVSNFMTTVNRATWGHGGGSPLGRNHTEEEKKHISEALTGKPKSEAHKESMAAAGRTKDFSRDHREAISKSLKALWARPGYKESRLRDCWGKPKGITQPEYLMNLELEELFPNIWKFNGVSRDLIVGSKIPDFFSLDGSNRLVEVFGRYWHSRDEVDPLIEYYLNFGYKCTVFWDFEVTEVEYIKSKLDC